uniref:CopG-like protein n=1 Tax=Sulfolobus neozealandicus TaxID=299422 RepID=Q5NE05_9CREN|nr:hypothetical protein [Sulfolobus neozealandicus]CAH89322.1 CopG-like protein [Sulfolobus neozealandicus]
MRYPLVSIHIEIPYEEYKRLVEKKGDKTWRQVLLEWAEIQGVKG